MKRTFIVMFAIPAFLALNVGSAFTAVLSTSGVSARGISLEGAFTGLADDASAVYYNPAGLTQIKGTEIEIGNSFIFPKITYEDRSGNEHESDKSSLGPCSFFSMDIKRPLIFAFGVYAPFARDASFTAGPGNFNARRAMLVRIDYTPTVAIEIGPQLSIGAGFSLSYAEMDGEATRAVGLHIEEADGWGYGGILGVLYKLNEQIQFGGTYHTRETVKFEGHASQAGTRDDFTCKWNFPSTVSMGLAYKPIEKLTLTFNLDWVEWSHYHHLTRDFDTLSDITDLAECDDIWEPRVGVEFKPGEDLAFRLGYLYDKEAGPSKNITPTAPDLTVHSFGFGASKKLKDFKMDITYELTIADTRSVGDSAAGLNGDFDLTSHLLMTSGSYRF